MRWVVLVAAAAVTIGAAGAAKAQVLWLGAGGGASWTWVGEQSSLLRGKEPAYGFLVGIPMDEDAVLRLRGVELPLQPGAQVNLRAATVGVDYFFPGVFGSALFLGGIGGYRLGLPADRRGEAAHGRWELGYYLGVGEWFSLSRRTRLTLEITWDRCRHRGTPTLLTAMAGLAVAL